MNEKTSFAQWFYIVSYYLREVLKYEGEINEKYFRFDYDNDENLTCEDAAKNFIKQIQ